MKRCHFCKGICFPWQRWHRSCRAAFMALIQKDLAEYEAWRERNGL